MGERYLKQIIVIRKDLTMPAGKLAAMAAHAAMTFLVRQLRFTPATPGIDTAAHNVYGSVSCEQQRWLTELDPGLEDIGQVSFAKIVCAVDDEPALLALEAQARDAGLTVHRVVDSGYSHNKPGSFAAIAIGPHWPEQLAPMTGALKVYR